MKLPAPGIKSTHNHTEVILQESPRWRLLTCILCWYCSCKELWDDPGVASPDTPSIRCEMKLLRDLRVEKTVVLFSKSSMALEMDRKSLAKHSEQAALSKRDPSLPWGNTKHKVFHLQGKINPQITAWITENTTPPTLKLLFSLKWDKGCKTAFSTLIKPNSLFFPLTFEADESRTNSTAAANPSWYTTCYWFPRSTLDSNFQQEVFPSPLITCVSEIARDAALPSSSERY